jgi:hypothetical protein
MPHSHGAHLMVDAAVLPLKARGLARIEAAGSDAIGNASLLVELALPDGLLVRGRRGGLGNGDGGRCNQGRRENELEESHGVSPSVTAVAEFRFLPLTLSETPCLEIRSASL